MATIGESHEFTDEEQLDEFVLNRLVQVTNEEPLRSFLKENGLRGVELAKELTGIIWDPSGGPLRGEGGFVRTICWTLIRTVKNFLSSSPSAPSGLEVIQHFETLFEVFHELRTDYGTDVDTLNEYVNEDLFLDYDDFCDELKARWQQVSSLPIWDEAVQNARSHSYTFNTPHALSDKCKLALQIIWELEDLYNGRCVFVPVMSLGKALGARNEASAKVQGSRTLDTLQALNLIELGTEYVPKKRCRHCKLVSPKPIHRE